MQIVIELPLPAKELSPNSRCHWRAKAKAVKAYRAMAHLACYRDKEATLLMPAATVLSNDQRLSGGGVLPPLTDYGWTAARC